MLDNGNGSHPGAPGHEVKKRPLASISLDLDNLWSYLKIHGDAGWSSFPSYLDALVEVVLDRLRAHGLTVTVFIVGQDAALSKNAAAMRAIADAGHEIGNHSFSHEPWFHTYDAAKVESEIADAEVAIERATGQRPRGFRGPGFSLSPETLRVLRRRGYVYDASTFPTFLGPLARAYYFLGSRHLSRADREQRKQLFGTAKEGLRDIRPYLWDLSEGAPSAPCNGKGAGQRGEHELLEIPVTTMPFARTPIHMSYVAYLALYSPRLALAYWQSALALSRATGQDLSFLLHPLDFLGKDKETRLSFFPGMRADTDFKLKLFDDVITLLKGSFETVTMSEHARVLLDSGHLKTTTPS